MDEYLMPTYDKTKRLKHDENEMRVRQQFSSFGYHGFHKGFYNDDNASESLNSINYSNFFTEPDDDSFPYQTAYMLLCGSCHIFALSLQKLLKYNAYIIEGNNKCSFHSFCQVYRNKQWYYIDARGITSSFDEFMDIAKTFVSDEYTIRAVSDDDIKEWKKDCVYDKEAYEFAKAIIRKYKECYTI